MQKIKITSSAGEIILSDSNESSIDGVYVPLKLLNFDPNSNTTVQNAVTCVNMHGQHTISSTVAPKILSFDIIFNGEYLNGGKLNGGGVKKMYEYRRKILTHIPVNKSVEIEYTNDNRTYYINARLVEIPVFNSAGSICSSKIFMTADFPFWHRSVNGKSYTATYDQPINITVNTEGDIESPIIGTIKCVKQITGSSSGVYFQLTQTTGSEARMRFVKNLAAGQTLMFNSGMNNEVWVKLIDADGTEKPANNYVSYRNSDLLVNNPGATTWRLAINGTAGELTIQMQYQNLYIGV